ncbi:hypothetical protein M8J75_004992 [Diaphorina citri]|nr:hypothetical protein M8J75_004992 [Diaphorina citri]
MKWTGKDGEPSEIDKYQDKNIFEDTNDRCPRIKQDTNDRCPRIKQDTNDRCPRIKQDTNDRCPRIKQDTNDRCPRIKEDTSDRCPRIKEDTSDRCPRIKEDTSDRCPRIKGENRLAKRARSIKQDFFGIFSSIRSTSKSPSPKPYRDNVMKTADEQSLSHCFKQVMVSLGHLLDVISKNTLEMLPGNGTIVLDTVCNVHSLVTSHDLNCQSSIVHSTLNQVFQSVANLIKFCDDYFLYNNNDEVNEELAKECVAQVEQAVINLVSLVDQNSHSSLVDTSVSDSSETMENSFCLNKSWESITMSNPPSKPPLDRNYSEYPPPLPPKKKSLNVESDHKAYSLEQLSVSSQGEYDFNSLQDYSTHHDTIDGTHSPQLLTHSSQYISYSSSVSSSSQHVISNAHHHINVNQVSNLFETNSVSSSSAISGTAMMLESVELSPPPLPSKQNARRQRHDSHYDNVPELLSMSLNYSPDQDDTPPPLPPKKKHIMAYMEMFGHCHETNIRCLSDTHSSCTCSLFTQSYHSHQIQGRVNMNHYHQVTTDIQQSSLSKWIHEASRSSLDTSLSTAPSPSPDIDIEVIPPALPPKKVNIPIKPSNYVNHHLPHKFPNDVRQDNEYVGDYESNTEDLQTTDTSEPRNNSSESLRDSNIDFIEELDVRDHLIFTEDGQDIRGAHPDALLVHATRDNNEHLYQDAFLTTFRTFKTPLEIIKKLIDRYHKFVSSSEVQKQRAARETFSFLVQVVSELTVYELDDNLVKYLTDFIYQLLSSGHFKPARGLRVKLLAKYDCKNNESVKNEILSSLNVYTTHYTLLAFKSEHIAEQMTLLDSDLFIKIEIPEVLAWIEQQNEEKSPNLTRFTEHFNKVSYWARTRILEQNEARDREKYVVKFIKIMKHLRKMNNFNSYLGLLSALDSAPIRRLEWQKHITEGLKEYCALIDSTSSFRAYRQALAETQPPCIPYIGLVLQDLTFVHIGNPHLLPCNELPPHVQYKNVINFSKRRQQFNIVQNMKRFRSGVHKFPRHDRIIEFFSNFDDFLSEEAMWQMSETIKPRGKPKH